MNAARVLGIALSLAVLASLPTSGRAAEQAGEPADVGFSGLATLDIQVRDRAEALKWFTNVLGFEHLFTAADLNWAEVRSPVANGPVLIARMRDPSGNMFNLFQGK